jgi:hypothetical protein
VTRPRPLEDGELEAAELGLALLGSDCAVCAGPHLPSDPLATVEGRRAWARDEGQRWPSSMRYPVDDLPRTRGILRRYVEHPESPGAARRVEQLLTSGRLRLRLQHCSTLRREPLGSLAWVAAWGLATIVSAQPGRVRRCAHPSCGCYFLDTSRNGRRRWCAMALCGNRVKALRHYRKGRS